MSQKNKLILLADRLDRDGLSTEATLIDEVIVKRSFEQENRADIKGVLDMVHQYLADLEALSGDVMPMPDGTPGTISEDQAAMLSDKVVRIREAIGFIEELNDLPSEEGWEEGSDEGSAEIEEEVEEEVEEQTEEEGSTPWWNFWSSSEEGDSQPEDDSRTPIEDPPTPIAEVEEFDEEGDGPDGSRTKRVNRPGVNVEQSMSNVGNVTIGE